MVEAVVDQLTTRNQPLTLPRVVLVGKPNAGKSSLFNALLNECGASREKVRALVSEQAGTTRDFLSASVDMGGLKCELIDTAGSEANSEVESIGSFAQEMTATQRKQADCCVLCLDATEERIRDLVDNFIEESQSTHWNCLALTKCDLLQHNQTAIPSHPRVLFCSSLTGAGVNELRTAIAATLGALKNSPLGVSQLLPLVVARASGVLGILFAEPWRHSLPKEERNWWRPTYVLLWMTWAGWWAPSTLMMCSTVSLVNSASVNRFLSP